MASKKFLGNVVLIALVIGLILLAYRLFFKDSASDAPALLGSDGAPAGLAMSAETDSAAARKDFLAILARLQAIDLESDLFSDPVFRNFRDFSQPLEPEPNGRPNPFEPFNPDAIWISPDSLRPATSTATSSLGRTASTTATTTRGR